MSTELEKAIRAIVRDEVRKVMAPREQTPKVRGMSYNGTTVSGVRQAVRGLLDGLIMTTEEIGDTLFSEDLKCERSTFKSSIRNMVFVMHRDGELVADKSESPWRYTLANKSSSFAASSHGQDVGP